MKTHFTRFNLKYSLFPGLYVLLVCLIFSPSATAVLFDNDFEEKEWKEIEVHLPAFPKKENLIPFKVGAITDTQFLIDGQSISIDTDGVIRFTLVIISSAGAHNISYEGIRCATIERRAYAFGRSDKTWSKAKNSEWKRIPPGINHYSELHGYYFCPIGEPSLKTPDDARRALTK